VLSVAAVDVKMVAAVDVKMVAAAVPVMVNVRVVEDILKNQLCMAYMYF
jgi:hypothetical protein